ncbi:MAG: 2-oxo acid dehydrogenase subunit E2 [Clostridia bacterium]|nr:2-oxo acid dehydrogenase subunit E2 [Clostridia bacterium]
MDFKEYMRGALTAPEKGDTVEYFNLKARVSGNVLTNAQLEMPAASYIYEADITKLWEEYRKLKADCGYRLSFNALMMRALVEGLKVAPRLNSHIEYNHTASCGRLIIKKHIDVAMPVFFESGETFPVKVRGIEVMSLKQIAEEIDNVIERLGKTDVNNVLFDTIAQRMIGSVLKGKLWSSFRQITSGFIGKYKVGTLKTAVTPRPKNPEGLGINDLNEGTVCFTNWSSLGKDFEGNVAWTPLLYPQVFLMAIGNTRDREYAFRNEKGEVDLGTKKMLPITLVFDHRLGGFADLAPFIKKLNEIFENPEIIREW